MIGKRLGNFHVSVLELILSLVVYLYNSKITFFTDNHNKERSTQTFWIAYLNVVILKQIFKVILKDFSFHFATFKREVDIKFF